MIENESGTIFITTLYAKARNSDGSARSIFYKKQGKKLTSCFSYFLPNLQWFCFLGMKNMMVFVSKFFDKTFLSYLLLFISFYRN